MASDLGAVNARIFDHSHIRWEGSNVTFLFKFQNARPLSGLKYVMFLEKVLLIPWPIIRLAYTALFIAYAQPALA